MSSPAENDSLLGSQQSEAKWIGPALILVTTLMWSTSGAFAKSAPLAEMPAEVRGPFLACFRTLFAALFLLPFAWRSGFTWHRSMIWMLLSFATMNITFVSALAYTSAAASIFLQCTSAVWAPLLGFLFLGESIGRSHKIGLVPILVGIVFIVLGDWKAEFLFGNILALVSGIAYAGVVVSLRHLRGHNPYYLAFLNHFVSGIVILPWLFSVSFFSSDFAPTNLQWMLAACMGVFQMGLPYVLFGFGLKRVTASEASLLVLIEPLFNPFWVWLLWSIPILSQDFWGGMFIFLGLLMRYLLERKSLT